jgi:hypothetical protein
MGLQGFFEGAWQKTCYGAERQIYYPPYMLDTFLTVLALCLPGRPSAYFFY